MSNKLRIGVVLVILTGSLLRIYNTPRENIFTQYFGEAKSSTGNKFVIMFQGTILEHQEA